MNRYLLWQTAHERSLEEINKYKSNPKTKDIINFLLDTNINVYKILPQEWAEKIFTAEDFACLSRMVYVSVLENTISFICFNTGPKIIFCSKNDPKIKEYIKKSFSYELKNIELDDLEFKVLSDFNKFLEEIMK